MPACTILLLSLIPTTTIPNFLKALSTTPLKPIVISRVIRWIILPTKLSTSALLAQNISWTLLLILPTPSASLPPSLHSQISHTWTIQAGVPSRLLQDFPSKNATLLHPPPSTIPPLTDSLSSPLSSSSAQDLELSTELQHWISSNPLGDSAVSMLNLLAFKEGMKGEYLKYGAEFARSIGRKRGGDAKIVGSVIHGDGKKDKEEEGEQWDEIALAHYPSLTHFADMLASEDFQSVNKRYRVGSLRDTAILCTCEVGLGLDGDGRAKL